MPVFADRIAATAARERALVVLRGVQKRFSNGTLAVSGFSDAVEAHEIVSLLDPSRCKGGGTMERAASPW